MCVTLGRWWDPWPGAEGLCYAMPECLPECLPDYLTACLSVCLADWQTKRLRNLRGCFNVSVCTKGYRFNRLGPRGPFGH